MSIKQEFREAREKFRLLSLYQRFERVVVMFLTALIPSIPYIAWLGFYSVTMLGLAGTAANDPGAMFGSLLGVFALLPVVAICTLLGWGAGTFQVSRRKAGEGRNPQTGEKIKIAAANVPRFKASKALKDAIN